MKKCLTSFLFLILWGTLSFGQMSGTYYIGNLGTGPGGSDPDYQTLKAACDFVMTAGVGGNITFLITSDLTEPQAVHLGVNTSGYSITFRPATDADITITFTKTSDNTASSGGLVVGLSADNWANLVTTDNIIIDGYASGGSTRRLTLQTASPAFSAHTPIHIVGDANNITIKNCILKVNQTSGNSAFGAVSMRIRVVSASDNRVPDNIVVDNCNLTTNTPSGAGIFYSYTGTSVPTVSPIGLEFKNNSISVKHRAISLNYSGTSNIYNNTISVNQLSSGFASFGIGGTSSGLVLTNVYNNKIIQLVTGNTIGGSNGIRGIQASAGGTWNIYNNFITGFSTPATGTTEVVGIRCGSVSNIYHNTIVMNNVSTTGPGTTPTGGIVTYTSSVDMRNNIIITEEDDFASYCIYAQALPTTSDYNLFYRTGTTNANIGYSSNANRPTLSDWQTATSRDANSTSAAVNFVSSTDLYLSGSSIGDNNLIATVLSGYSTDIDGNTRDSYYPYKGADESLAKKLPSAFHTVSMSSSLNNLQAFGNGSLIGSDGSGINFFANWDNTYLYLGWSGGRTNYSSDMYYAAIDTDPDGTNGITNSIEDIGFLTGGPMPDHYVVYENNSTYYGVPPTTGNTFEVYGIDGGNWSWLSSTTGDNGTSSQIDFQDSGGEVRLRVPWTTLGGFTPGTGNKLGILMWNNNPSGNYMWARVPTSNPANGSTPITLTRYFVYSSTAAGVNPAADPTDTPLPVELVSFTGTFVNNTVVLNWKTATEINSYGFEIERSNDLKNWETIGFVNSSGNSNSPKNYSFTDEKPLTGTISYRLKQIDIDGNYSYSNIVTIETGKTSTPDNYSLSQNYPNPFNPVTKITYTLPKDSDVRLLIYSFNGELVQELVNQKQTAGVYNVIFDGSNLASGTYIYRLIANDFVMTKKMLLIK